jgi:two-component system, LytTR family, response regulator
VDYLLKPVSPQRLAEAIARLGQPQRTVHPPQRLSYDGHLFIESGPLCGFVAVNDIRCILAEGDYSRVVLGAARSALVLRPLAEWEDRLPEERFARIHRSAIVNRDHITRMEPRAGGGFRVFVRELRDPIAMSRRYARALRARQSE